MLRAASVTGCLLCAGRGALVDAIAGRVKQLVEQHTGGLVLIEGEPGEK